eukprot:PRCOL_00002298-RA
MAGPAPGGVQSMSARQLVDALGLVPHPEGGFFLETWRTGCTPMTTMGQSDPAADGTVSTARGQRRPDGDGRRNALTSIYWMPTRASPRLPLGVNLSDHVHYYHCGAPFEYTLYDPATGEMHVEVLGPDVLAGHRLQVCVKGGTWKCGRLLCGDAPVGAAGGGGDPRDHCLLGEAVAPGFDFHDFAWVTRQEVDVLKDEAAKAALAPYVHERIDELADAKATIADAEAHYAEDTEAEAKRRL